MQENGVIPVPDNYDQAKQAGLNGLKERLRATINNNKGALFLSLMLFIVAVKWKNVKPYL
jgi:phage-related protein